MYLECICFCVVMLFSYQCLANEISLENCTRVDNRTLRCSDIPREIDSNISRVQILSITDVTKIITHATFNSSNWRNVQHLEFKRQSRSLKTHFVLENKCFANLVNLQALRIHAEKADIFPDTFFGLDSVKTLDISDCPRFKFYQFTQALNGTNILPQLNTLILSNLGSLRGTIALNDSFVDILLPRKITHLDISGCQISFVNITAVARKLKHLTAFNVSYSIISDTNSHGLSKTDLEHVENIDFSHTIFPSKSVPIIPGKIEITNANIKCSQLHSSFKLLLIAVTFNISGNIPTYSSIEINNSTAIIDVDLPWRTQNLVLQENGLNRLDFKILCEQYNFSSLRSLDLSENEMEFLHPSVLYCLPNLETVELSRNNLYQMAEENFTLFEMLFSELPNLTYIGLARNSLKSIPMNTFINSNEVETIDLSWNKLKQITFRLTRLDHLQVLDLSHNSIQVLDSSSLSHLDSIPRKNTSKDHSATVVFTANPILCSECQAKPFIQWLLSTSFANASAQNLKCINKNHHLESIKDSVIKNLQKICIQKTIIISASVTAVVMFILSIILIGIIYTRKRRQQKMQNRANVINRLREGEDQHEFVAYLAYSSDDQDFVMKYVLHQLNENLQLMTGIDRELICTGDKHLRVGFDIHSEFIRCLERSSVVIVVVSREFCTSEYCHHELDQAYIRRKPIVLMFKEHVSEDDMMPTMKELYRKNVRMLWTYQNGEYVLKSTWDNVCTSVLDLVQCDA